MNLKQKKLRLHHFDDSKKSICFIISSGISLRNLLLESSFKKFIELEKKYNVIIITEKNYLDTYSHDINFVQIEYINNKLVLMLIKILNIFARLIFDKLNYTNSKKLKYKYKFLTNQIYSRIFFNFRFFIPQSNLLLFFISKINYKLIKFFSPEIKNLIKILNPEHVISLDPINKKESPYIIHSYEICNTSAIVKSFDNITTKGFIPFIPKNIFVWNEIMVRDAMKAYGYCKPNIYAIGAFQYDHAKTTNNLVKTKSNQILYCTNSSDIYNNDKKIIEYILTFIEDCDFKLFIRVKQTDKFQKWEKYRGFRNVEIYPKVDFKNHANKYCSTKNHQLSLMEQINDSFVVISSYSSIILDTLSLKTPCINLGYSNTIEYNGWSTERIEKFDHIKPLISPLCVDNVRSNEELKTKIIHRYKYGFDEKEEKSRKKFVDEFLGANSTYSAMDNLIRILDLD